MYVVGVLHYNNFPGVLATIRDLKCQTLPALKIFVIDNSPTDSRLRRALDGVADVEYLARDNMGYAAGMNTGFAAANLQDDWDAFLCVTHEVRLKPDTLETLYKSLLSNPELGAVGPLLCRLSREAEVWSAGGTLSQRMLRVHHMHLGASRSSLGVQEADCAWLDGAVLAIRRTAWEAVGGFDEKFFLYWEEVDLAIRIAAAGYKVRCVLHAVAWQEPSGTPLYLESRNRLLLLRKHGDCWEFALEALCQAVRLPRAVVGSLTGRRSPRDLIHRVCGLRDGVTGKLHREYLN